MWLKDKDLVLQLEYHSHIKWREFLPQVEVSKHNAYKETTLHVLKWSRPMLVIFPPVYVRKKTPQILLFSHPHITMSVCIHLLCCWIKTFLLVNKSVGLFYSFKNLGHLQATFSFPCLQKNNSRIIFIQWAKAMKRSIIKVSIEKYKKRLIRRVCAIWHTCEMTPINII